MHRSRIYRDDLLEGKKAIVTGGGTGIGAAITAELAALGCEVFICSRKQENVEPAAREIREAVGKHPVHWGLCDIRKHEEVDRVVDEALQKMGRIDFLVNNAGGQFPSPAAAYTDNGWNAVIGNNLTGPWYFTQSTAKKALFRQNGGKVIFITADCHRGMPGLAHTSAARAGAQNLAMTLAIEWASFNIKVNCVAPGTVFSTGMRVYPKDVVFTTARHIPLKRLGSVEEIAQAVTYLLSPAGDWITGETLKIDGGAHLWGDRWPIPDPKDFEKTHGWPPPAPFGGYEGHDEDKKK
ncbi:MAG: SDR family oxidoreductase [Deltaproteobacteria bacterium]|nr:SDR family oxidoreductase [Deltaproteobacteria bacterium]